MSRIGKQPIILPEKVSAIIQEQTVQIKGPKGELSRVFPRTVHVVMEEEDGAKRLRVSMSDVTEKEAPALWGTARANLANMVEGVTKGFSKKLEVIGVGYRVAVSGRQVVLNVGFSHPVHFPLPEGVEAKAEEAFLTVSGADIQAVGEVAARIRAVRKPEPYNGKGIKYTDEVIRRKAGKAAKTAE